MRRAAQWDYPLSMSTSLSRRRFIQTVAAGAALTPFLSVPGRGQGRMLRHASIGASGQALADLKAFATHPSFDLIAVADVDLCRFEPLQKAFPKVRVYQDWRELLDREAKQIDSVNVSIPDHMHCLVAMEAMKRGKAVYVQKPLCNTLQETRLLTEQARRRRLVSQMGIQVSSTQPQRYGEALARSGLVGKIREVHTFSHKNWGDDKPLPEGTDPVPAAFAWDEWLGVSAPRPFKSGIYHPAEWRRRVGFGTGTLGDMGCHIYSPPYRALKLTSPVAVTSYGPAPSAESWATSARVKVTYPGTEFTTGETVDVWWYDGGEKPPDAIREQIGDRMPQQGTVFVGADGLLVLPHSLGGPFAMRGTEMLTLPAIEIAERDHYHEYIDAALAGTPTCSASFDYAGPLTESVLIGNVAAHFPGETLAFNARELTFPGKREADQFLSRDYRSDWRVKT